MSRLTEILERVKRSDHARDVASRAFLVIFSSVLAFQLLIPLVSTWQDESSFMARLIVTALMIVFIATWSFTVFTSYFRPRSWVDIFSARDRWILRAVTGFIATVLVLWQGDDWASSLVFVVVLYVITGPPLSAFASAIQSLLFATIVLVIARVDTTLFISVLFFSLLYGLLIAAQMRQGGVIGEMMQARYAEIRMAAAEERLRIARDLHDVLGHTLSLMTLKSELANRLIETDPERARQEIRDVETLARSAMNDVRQTVSEERQPLLTIELEDARELLDAAGIIVRYDDRQPLLPDEIATLFAWGVREGVTNVVRHSRARHCTITMSRGQDRAALSITDDGPGSDAEASRAGTGLVGLRQRAGELDGSMLFEKRPDQTGHRLMLDVPLPSGER